MQQDKMAAVGSYRGLPIGDRESLQDVDVPAPLLRPRDVMVRVSAVSVNPADVKIRASLPPSQQPRILGFPKAGRPHIRRGRRAPADGHHGVGDPRRAQSRDWYASLGATRR
jgi:hypothetical protein